MIHDARFFRVIAWHGQDWPIQQFHNPVQCTHKTRSKAQSEKRRWGKSHMSPIMCHAKAILRRCIKHHTKETNQNWRDVESDTAKHLVKQNVVSSRVLNTQNTASMTLYKAVDKNCKIVLQDRPTLPNISNPQVFCIFCAYPVHILRIHCAFIARSPAPAPSKAWRPTPGRPWRPWWLVTELPQSQSFLCTAAQQCLNVKVSHEAMCYIL